MKRIAIIGANGQVGTEVCLYLRDMPGVEPAPICRSRAGAVFLRRHGFECRIGSPSDPKQARELLDGCDVVADFTLPTGSAHEVREQMRALIPTAVSATPARAPYVYLSSITAFGFRDFLSPLRSYRLSRNAYGSSKRYAEALVRSSCSRTGRPAHILRVGVVHGELQSVTRDLIQRARANAGRVAHVPNCESFTVFAFSIAETLSAVAHGEVAPDSYTLLSNPGWAWRDLHEYLSERAGVDSPRYRLIGPDPAPNGWKQAAAAGLAPAKRILWKQKDLIQGYLSASMPQLEHRLRATYHCRNAAAEIREGERSSQYRPYGNNHSILPGPRIGAISDSRVTMAEPSLRLRRALSGLRVETAHQTQASGNGPR